MQDTPAFIRARELVRENVDFLLRMHGAYHEGRVKVMHHDLEREFNATVSLPVLEEVIQTAEEWRLIDDCNTDMIGMTPANPDFWPTRSTRLAEWDDQVNAKIRELLTDRVLAEYTAKAIAA